MDQEGVAICECLDGYFRNDENRMTDSNAQSFVRNFDEPPSTKCSRESLNPLVNQRILLYSAKFQGT